MSRSAKTIRVLLADDHEVVRQGFRTLLEHAGEIEIVDSVASGEAACQACLEHRPDVIVMDLSMPGIGGLEASRRILQRDRDAAILLFTMHASDVFLSRAMDIGVRGYITKQSASEVLVEAVRQLAAGEMYIGQEMMPHLVQYGMSGRKTSLDGLSPREFEVFLLLAGGASVAEAARTLKLSPKTVGHHSTSIRNKLNVSSNADLARIAIRNSLIDA